MAASLITGGAGFIGSHLADHLIAAGENAVVLDALTYAGTRGNLAFAEKTGKLVFVKGNVCDTRLVHEILKKYEIGTVYHLAAESHVDNSIENAVPFIQTNIAGTYSMLAAALKYRDEHPKTPFRFVHVSTDEVFGHLEDGDAAFHATSPYRPNSPYSASKAGADHLVRAWFRTYGLPAVITHCSNNYGPRQHREKFIPTVIASALAGKPIPVYGTGENIRDWLYVKDHCEGLVAAAKKGHTGQSYCFGGGNELRNIALAKEICAILDKTAPRADKKPYADQIALVADRKGHDWRYAIDFTSSKKDLDWQPRADFTAMLADTCAYFVALKNS